MNPRRDFEDLGLRSEARLSEDLREEMEAHIAHRIDDLLAGGMPREEARIQAEREFGDLGRIERDIRSARIRRRRTNGLLERLDTVRQDVAFALRQLRRSPGFGGVAIATLALGIGAALTVGSVVRTVVLEPLPFERPDELVEIMMLNPAGHDFSVSEPVFLEWRERLESYDDIGALAARGAIVRAPGEPLSIERGYVNAGFVELLGLPMVRGRSFLAEEDEGWSAAPVAMVSSSFWRTRMGATEDLASVPLRIDDQTFTVVGVFPPALELVLPEVPVVTPLAASPRMDRGEHYLTVIGRLRPEVDPTRAAAELEAAVAVQGEVHPVDRDWSGRLQPLRTTLIGPETDRAGWVLLVAAGLLMTMACLNVSSLLLARAATRRTELGVRAALGAGDRRLALQLATETGVLVLFGGVLGTGLAALALPVVRTLSAGRVPRVESAGLDPAFLGVAVLVTAAATLLFGAVPLFSRGGGAGGLLVSGQRGGSTRRSRLRTVLVVSQLAVSLVLLTGTGLLFRSLWSLSRVDPGFEAEGTLAATLSMPDGSWGWQERGPLMAEILDRVEAVPGVERAGATAIDPFSGSGLANSVAREDRLPDRAADFQPIHWRAVTPGFFEAMALELRVGRAFLDDDVAEDGPSPVVIDVRLAEILFGSAAEAVGATLVWGDPSGSRMTVLGVVEELRDVTLADEPAPMIYRIHAEIPWAVMTVVARIRGEPEDAAGGIREAIAEVAPGLPVPELRTLEENVDRMLAEPRFNTVLLGAFAGAGLLLAVVGLYGLTAFEVRQRFREIGIRLSLGARPEGIRAMIVRERMVLAVIGVAIGALAALWLAQLVDSLLHGVDPLDPLSWSVAAGLLLATSFVAAWIPARRATRIDPGAVLRGE